MHLSFVFELHNVANGLYKLGYFWSNPGGLSVHIGHHIGSDHVKIKLLWLLNVILSVGYTNINLNQLLD